MYKLRFIDSQICDGAMNMAIDEVLTNSMSTQSDLIYLRFYQWQPATLSFGYNQKIEKLIDADAARNAGIDLVRRMSGGKMVFHNIEHTFSLGLPGAFIEDRIGRGRPFLEIFKFAITPLVDGLIKMGIPARFAASREMRHSSNNLHCYATAAGHSIYAEQRKLVGAAGVFRQNTLTIHGSIPIKASFPPDHIFPGNTKIDHDVEMAALSDFCTLEKALELPRVIADAYSEHLGCELIYQPINREEFVMAGKIANNKYNNLFWKASD
ncbi:MAG: hypothetical protein KKB51_07655 [Candidatus Riflebacteria bacterium]|nr:hypothetical protein [Candidatus Riflebacteria bacterium]